MGTNWRTYSVFISSTFADMQSERDYLRTQVFPQINDELKKYCIKLRPIDLRWGINTLETNEESVEEKVLRICLEEINRSKPFFLGLLGNRYGYIPPKDSIREIGSEYQDLSITAIEISYGLLRRNDISGCLFLERDSSCYNGMDEHTIRQFDESQETDYERKKEKLNKLKEQIKSHLAKTNREDCYLSYSPTWNGKKFVELEDFGNKVKESILREIISYYGDEGNDAPFVDEIRAQEEFMFLRRARLFSREKLCSEISEKIENCSGVMLIYGDSGSGKSCLYTMLVDKYKPLNENYIVLYHATDTGQNGKDLSGMLARWCYQIEEELQISHVDTAGYEETMTYFRQLLKKIPDNKMLLMLIDSIEGFQDSEAGSYLTFIPKAYNSQWMLLCTCIEDSARKIVTYHKKAEVLGIPQLSVDEAKGIIEKYTGFENKELYEENIKALLGKRKDGRMCAESPIWLSLALNFMTSLGRDDFAAATAISQLHKGSFDRGLIDYINKQIEEFPDNPKELFLKFLFTLKRYYDDFPMQLCKILSASFNGLDEDVLAELMGKDWDLRTFAAVRTFLQGYLSEQSQLRTWRIMHKMVTLDLKAGERQELVNKLACIYIRRLSNNEIVNDNITYYLIEGNNFDSGLEYLSSTYKNEKRIADELCQVTDIEDIGKVMSFMGACYSKRRKGLKRLIPRSFSLNTFKEAVLIIAKKALYEGKYEKAREVIDSFQIFIEKQKIPSDFKMLYYILTDEKRFDALERICDKEALREEYTTAVSHLKVRGPLSMVFVPITKKYYKWMIFKLK